MVADESATEESRVEDLAEASRVAATDDDLLGTGGPLDSLLHEVDSISCYPGTNTAYRVTTRDGCAHWDYSLRNAVEAARSWTMLMDAKVTFDPNRTATRATTSSEATHDPSESATPTTLNPTDEEPNE